MTFAARPDARQPGVGFGVAVGVGTGAGVGVGAGDGRVGDGDGLAAGAGVATTATGDAAGADGAASDAGAAGADGAASDAGAVGSGGSRPPHAATLKAMATPRTTLRIATYNLRFGPRPVRRPRPAAGDARAVSGGPFRWPVPR